MENYEALQAGAKSYLEALLFTSQGNFGLLWEEYTEEDASEETLSFVAGEAYAILRFIENLIKVRKLSVVNINHLMRQVCDKLVLVAAEGDRVSDFMPVEGFGSSDFTTLHSWYVDRLFQGKLAMYAGDDHKLYVEGFEWKREFALEGESLTPYTENTLSYTRTAQAVSKSAAELETAFCLKEVGWKLISCKEIGNENLYTGART